MALIKIIRKRLGALLRKGQKIKPSLDKQKKEIPGAPEAAVEQAKFYTPAPERQAQASGSCFAGDLPCGYGRDKIVLQVRDPWWMHTYWEVQGATFEALKARLGDEFYQSRRLLRVYDVSQIIFNGTNAHRFFDIHINEYANSWYIDTGSPGRSWCVDLGLLLSDGRFITIVRSNTVSTPLAGPSCVTDEEWMIPDEMFNRLYGLGFGFGSSPVKVKGLWEERLKREITSGAVSSLSSPVRTAEARDFWLMVNTELIVYGATEPGAKVTVQAKEIKLRPDGTFTLRFALGDGKQAIPVTASSPDSREERTITPIVTRGTKS